MSILNNLEKVPRYAKIDIYSWADYIELICTINKDGKLSTNDITERIKKRATDLGEGNELEAEKDAEEAKKDRIKPEITDKLALFTDDIMTHLDYRSKVFGEYYPFIISSDKKGIQMGTSINDKQKTYYFFLLCSNLRVFSNYTSNLTSTFEDISFWVLKKFVPERLINAKQFGSSNVSGTGSLNLFQKIEALASDIKEEVKVKQEEISKYNKGDGGLDLYAWINFNDNLDSLPLYFAQCACTEEWVQKQHSSSYDTWSNFISLKTYPINIIFIPHCFRDGTGAWHQQYDIHKSVLIDRLRFINTFRKLGEDYTPVPNSTIIDEFLTLKEGIV